MLRIGIGSGLKGMAEAEDRVPSKEKPRALPTGAVILGAQL
jgi:hypothetical protein